MRKEKIVVALPALNSAKTIGKVYSHIPKDVVDEVVVVDDGSTDGTLSVIKKLGIKYKRHPKNRCYGGSQKTLFSYALKLGADIVILLHSDLQHDPRFIKDLLAPILSDSYDLVLGTRIRDFSDAWKNGMPLYKLVSNRFLTFLANKILDLHLSEYHTGFRAYKRKVLETVPFARFSDDFIFDQQILFSARAHNFRIGGIPTSCIYHKDSSSVNLSRSLAYGFGVLWNLFLYLFDKKRFI